MQPKGLPARSVDLPNSDGCLQTRSRLTNSFVLFHVGDEMNNC